MRHLEVPALVDVLAAPDEVVPGRVEAADGAGDPARAEDVHGHAAEEVHPGAGCVGRPGLQADLHQVESQQTVCFLRRELSDDTHSHSAAYILPV